MPQQFNNPANFAIHEKTTGPKIWEQTDGSIDLFVSGVGTGGTITGVSRYIKNTKNKQIFSVGVEPRESPVITQKLAGEELKPGPHKIQGIGAGFIPDTLDLSVVDSVEQVESTEAEQYARRLAREEGILVGISSGAAGAVAARRAQGPKFASVNTVASMRAFLLLPSPIALALVVVRAEIFRGEPLAAPRWDRWSDEPFILKASYSRAKSSMM